MFAFNSSNKANIRSCAATKDGASSNAAVGFRRLSKATTVRVGGARKEATTSVRNEAETPAARGFTLCRFLKSPRPYESAWHCREAAWAAPRSK